MKVKEKKWIRFRIYIVGFFFIAGLGIVLARAYQLQIIEKDKLTSIARSGYRKVIKLPPKRGTIKDREGHELAISIEVGSIYAHPKLVKQKKYTAGKLSQILQLNRDKITRSLESKRTFVWVKRKRSPEKIKQVQALKLEGVGSTTETRRYYPGKEIAAHIIGFSGQDNQGLEGLEKKYDKILKGPQSTLIQMQDALRRPFFISMQAPDGKNMENIVLTIDKSIQYKAQQALKWAVEKSRARSGHCIIMNPETGEILAMAVVPQFNPNIFQKYRPFQWRNRTITDCYEPGSTIKAFLLAAALDQGTVSPGTRFFCENGEYQFAKHIIHDTKKHGSMSVSDIIVLSSNIGAVKIGQKLGYKKFHGYLANFGFGSKTGIDLIGERRGFIRPVKKSRNIDRATIFFGQGMTASSIQLVTAMGAIANGGKLMRPFVVKKVTDQYGQVIKETRPQVVRRIISAGIAKKVTKILEGVVSRKGTAPLAAIAGYAAAGKTGTSQKVDPRTKKYSKDKYVAIFVGFVPVDKPGLVILVAIDEPKGNIYGGLVAGPVFKEVGAWALNHLRINPQVRHAEAGKKSGENHVKYIEPSEFDSQQDAVKNVSGLLPDFRGKNMRDVLTNARAMGLKVVLEGSGFAVKQEPRPGSSLDNLKIVKVNFRPPM